MNETTLSACEACRRLNERGVAQAIVLFSGGGDEGGVDQITLFDSTGLRLDDLNEVYYQQEKTEDHEIAEALGKPVYERYFTFAGEFYVNGEVIWDTTNCTFKFETDERSMYDDYNDE
jgi:hypothetical protein